jgi:RNA polymerase sigma-70 factor (ECF subfamily)
MPGSGPVRHFFFYHHQTRCKKILPVTTTSDVRGQDDLYQQAASEYGAALARLARGYEADPDKRRDLLQEIHISLWRSFEGFDGLCSLRTWVYRVAHNASTSYVIRQRRARPQLLVSLDEVEALPIEPQTDRKVALTQLTALIQRLKPVDRQVILAWLDGMDSAEIGELTGLSSGNVATKVHRIKIILARDFQGARNGRS